MKDYLLSLHNSLKVKTAPQLLTNGLYCLVVQNLARIVLTDTLTGTNNANLLFICVHVCVSVLTLTGSSLAAASFLLILILYSLLFFWTKHL